MADERYMAKPAANERDAGPPADDLQSLLDNLAVELTGAGARHTESINHMQGRVAALSDRASTVKPSLPHEYGAAIDRIEAAMSTFSERLSDAEPRAHAAAPVDGADQELPEAVRAEVRDAILNAQQPIASTPPLVGAVSPADVQNALAANMPPMPEPSWLEKRFSDIAGRLKQTIAAEPHNALQAFETRFGEFEQRFDHALDEITLRSDAASGSLQGIEQQIGEIVAQFDRTQTQLGRLDAIERRLSELRRDIPDEQMNRLIGALAPSDEKLSALAMAAAEQTAATIRKEMAAAPKPEPAPASPPVSDPRLVELTTMLDKFIGEQRQGEAQNAEALDTMQQAMQHLIDRVEAIEAAQTTNHEALMRARAAAEAEPRAFSVRSTPSVLLTPTALADAPTVAAEPAPRPMAELAVGDMPAPSRPRTPEVQGTPIPATPAPGERDRQAMIAMARRAAEKASSEPARTAGPAPRAAVSRSLSRMPRPGLLLAVSFAAFVLAGFWLVAGPGLRGLAPSSATTKTGDASHVIEAPERLAEPGESASEEAASPEPIKRANLATPVQPPPAPVAPVSVSTADLTSAIGQGTVTPTSAPGPSELPAMSRSVEMPPAMIGPVSLRNAAAKGDPRAQFEVAARFAEGKGVPKDFPQAATWYQRAAAQGLPMAQYRLAALYERGLGVPADPARARAWYARAAQQGNVRAMHNLAVLGAGRPGTSPDYAVAVQWFTEAANRGLADSQYNLGILYESGLGVPANNIEAYKWYALAARSGDKDATRRRDSVREKLDSSSQREADVLVIQWRAVAVENEANDVRGPSQGRQAGRQ